MKRAIYLRICFIMTVLGIFTATVAKAADQYDMASADFDDRKNYDIYFDTGEGGSPVIKHVQIVGYKEISGKVFLVIRSGGFNSKDYEGYILFDAITAILPEKNFSMEPSKEKRINY